MANTNVGNITINVGLNQTQFNNGINSINSTIAGLGKSLTKIGGLMAAVA